MKENKLRRTSVVGRRALNCIKKATHGARRASIAFLLLLVTLSGCTKQDSMYKESRVLMDTFCTITVVAPSKEMAVEAINAGFDEIKKLELLINYFSQESELSAINRKAGMGVVKVSAETMDMLEKSLQISKASGGTFDPTVAPLIGLWNFTKDRKDDFVPSEEAVKRARRLVDYKKIVIASTTGEVSLSGKEMEMDLGGIAKGYAADSAVTALKGKGIKAALVAVAGDIRGYGERSWTVGIQNPRPEGESDRPWEDVVAKLRLENMAISTSGDYQRFFVKDGKRYHHIIDPSTGYPAETDLISATVVAPEGYVADGMSTAVFVLGVDKGMALLERMGIEGVLIDSHKKVFITDGLRDKVEILDGAYQQ